MDKSITDEQWEALARTLDVKVAALQAVAAVESAGDGFLVDGRPKVLFEGHAFHRLTAGRFSGSHPTLSYATWTRKHYARTGAGEWERLDDACTLDRTAALQSASWGAFQIMGFNYAACGFRDVEAFVASQRQGAPEQLECFARFISRGVFLKALRKLDWAGFAAAYNGPRYRANHYAERLASAFAAFDRGAGRARTGPRTSRRKRTRRPPLGRREFGFVGSPPERGRQRPVKADPVDLRDWLYRPGVANAPPPTLLPHNPRPVVSQGNTSACTGFALATVVEYLLDQASRPVERISGHMLYSMARRYDEWAGNEDKDDGSSLRGALKGWSRHGASALKTWKGKSMPPATNEALDWWLDAVRRPLGAYYRVAPDVVSDMQCALMEAHVLYASALTHAGWNALFVSTIADAPTAPEQIPVIDCRNGDPNGGHAFAIVGYTEMGFIVHNSWGPKWGRGGFGVLTYSDWRQNAMDCWVAQLGVVTLEHERVAMASSLRLRGQDEPQSTPLAGTPPVVLSSEPELANHEISPFVINMQNEGRLSTRGRFRTYDHDLTFLLEHHLKVAKDRWGVGKTGTIDVAIYAHGGLVDEDAAAVSAKQWIPLLYSNRIFPIFLMWETDGLSTVLNQIEDAIKGDDLRATRSWFDGVRDRLLNWKDQRIEALARRPGGAMWRQMKDSADDLSGAQHAGVVKLFRVFSRLAPDMPRIRLHLIGHSAGAIVHSHLAPRSLAREVDVSTISLLAPALRVDDFNDRLGRLVVEGRIPVLVAHLTDWAESSDPTCSPYGHSLLYLVSRALEGSADVPLLGMEKHLVPAVVAHPWGAFVSRLASPGMAERSGRSATTATTHGAIDDDIAVQDAVVRHIKGDQFIGYVVRNSRVSGPV